MKLSIKVAGLCASGVFILTALPGYYQHAKPAHMESIAQDAFQSMSVMETLGVSLIGALIAGIIGYVIGDILSNPKGHLTNKETKAFERQKTSKAGTLSTPVTGEETFLDDVSNLEMSVGEPSTD